ncbi:MULTISPECIES: ABC transporter ATP-binding protein [unclassified Paenibacillus]|uniref:ABC transporter ATP-binding protein n=1 Tax=unclassified Paenibacillus TaxID=185978 RepID=UPI0024052E0F|nr:MULTISPECIES: ABC transporter ATP-binding protein [unclassified Paenibacillus]MDF9839424.1 ABC-2 type transport system ATP-binding protein [Paenibacillus sp. PastF-2]MDF9846004.1 ABC-2 type transport system ATP-binding protein [Paenibacillus sp. PastM-2]MDF9852577.1 ABC-2 type transport system ATP-binding protein [Paenibacillus sp. PastF-1]MDH6477693.1 ABC-2 type transport system ATP-binding protein [Paenibacillus sp. PastH-2]MDH6505432.1 ABC-2 type transport system ATP-binding protein [Pae
MSVIEMNHLTKNYGKSRGIKDINLSVEEGEIFGFIGPNGAGKSTAIRTLLGLIYPTSGSAAIFGRNCTEHPEIRKELGYLPSEVFYYDNMKVIDLLKYSASFYKKDCTKRIRELAEIMDLDLKKRIDDLSFGNKKKVGIVQGLLHEPKLIILDEPTSGLDPLMQQKFFDLLREENRKGATVFFSSHILSEVQKMCSRVAFIKEGEIIKLEKMSTLHENNYKRINIEGVSTISKEAFDISGVSRLEVNGTAASFIFKGNINTIMQRLSETELRNISIDEPDLEEIFMHYYVKED